MKNRLRERILRGCGVGCLVLLLCCANGGVKTIFSGARALLRGAPPDAAVSECGKALQLCVAVSYAPPAGAFMETAKRLHEACGAGTLQDYLLAYIQERGRCQRGKPAWVTIGPLAFKAKCGAGEITSPALKGATEGSPDTAYGADGAGRVVFTLELCIKEKLLAVQFTLRRPSLPPPAEGAP